MPLNGRLSRRDFLEVGGAGLLGLGLGGCAARSPSNALTVPRIQLEPVRATWERVIRTTVGLRPFRPSGFVVRAEPLGDKTLIHNYGHGGAGHSLAWGTGLLAAELALQQESRRAAVIGCGTVGLTTARQLQRRGFTVTIYAKAVPPDTTSNMAFAGFTPTSGLVDPEHRTAAWNDQFRRAAEVSYRELQLLAGRNYGISWVPSYRLLNEVSGGGGGGGSNAFPLPPLTGNVILEPGQHPFPSVYAAARPTLRIEPSVYLDALVRDVLQFDGRIVIRQFDDARSLSALYEPVLVNCSGLGSNALFGDEELIPVKGQLTFLVPQPGVNYSTFGGIPGGRGGGFLHMMPRRDGIALGGTSERGVWDLEPDDAARRRIVQAHMEMFSRMTANVRSVQLNTDIEPPDVPKLESFFDLQS